MKNFIIGLASTLLLSVGAKAQATTILSETFEGGSGTTLAGWTFANGSQPNKWYVGTSAGNGPAATGSKAAYISNDAGSYNYNTGSLSVAHLYRDITLYSSSDTLSFDWKGGGETLSGTIYDCLQVFLVETTAAPTAGTALSTPLATCNLSGSWQRTRIALQASAGAKRLVFSWRNDGSSGTQPPAAIDNITVTTTSVPQADSMTVNLAAAGTLQSVAGVANVKKLVLTGSIDARDVKFMRDNMPFLAELDLSGAAVVAYEGEGGTYPWGNSSYPANEMPQYSFYNGSTYIAKTSLTSVKLPAGLTSIGTYALSSCSGLSGNQTLPVGLTSIGNYAFSGCSGLSSLTLPVGLTTIGNYAFSNCSGLTSVTNLNLTPQSINSTVFSGVTTGNVTLTVLPSSAARYRAADVWKNFKRAEGALIFSETFEGGSGATLAGWTFANGSQTNKWYVGDSAGNGPTATGSKAAYISNSSSGSYRYTITDSSVAHLYRNIALHSLADTLRFDWKGDGESVYDYLQVFLVATTVTPTAGRALSAAPLATFNSSGSWRRASVALPASEGARRLVFSWRNDARVGEQPPVAIDNIAITTADSMTVNLANAGTLQSIPGAANAKKLMLTGSIDARDVMFMRDSMPFLMELDLSGAAVAAYSGTGGTSSSASPVTYPANQMPHHSFYNGSTYTAKAFLILVKLPAGLTSIGSYAFSDCSGLSGSLTLPAGLTSIGSYAFSGCSGLSGSLTLPAGLATIGSYAFAGCSGFTSVINMSLTPQSIGSTVFSGVNTGNVTLTVLPSSAARYGAANVWKDFKRAGGALMLSETFEGGAGATLAGWTFVNGNYANKWYVGASAGNGPAATGSKAAYISNSSSGNYSYTITDSSVVHLYRDITQYSFADTLRFDWKGNGESGYDYLRVFLVEATVTPTAGRQLSNPLATFNGSDSWQRASIALPASAGAKRLVFSWRNDTRGGDQPPAAIDNIAITTTPQADSMTVNLANAGTLQNIPGVANMQKLVITGSMDARDVKFMRDSMPLLAALDLSGAAVAAYSGAGGTSPSISAVSYLANQMPQYSFYNGSTSIAKTSLASVRLPVGLTSIGAYAFSGCSGLSGSLTLPMGLTSIGDYAFSSCSGLTSVVNLNLTPQSINATVFSGVSTGNVTLTVLPSSVALYEAANVWRNFRIRGAGGGALILSETFEGGSGTTLAGWTFANGSQTNKWYVGASAGNGPTTTGSKAAYISNSSSGSYSYTISTSSVAHFYRNITLPSSSDVVILSFDWKGNGESGYDYLQVFLVETTVTPTAGTQLSNAPLATYNLSGSWQQASIALPASASAKRLVFSWRNDGNGGAQSPAAIDNIAITNVTAVGVPQEDSMTVNLTNAGTLQSVAGIANVQKLILTGSIDARDVKFMRDNMPLLAELDLSGAGIVAYSGTGGTSSSTLSVTYPANEMPQYSFYNISTYTAKPLLASVKLPTGLTSIGTWAFYSCSGLSGNLTLPAGVASIGSYAFAYCSGLTSVTNLSLTPQSISSNVFNEVNIGNVTLTVPPSSVALYKAADVWKDFRGMSSGAPILSETFEGGSGTTLAGWTFVNGSQTNKWYVGASAGNGSTVTGSKAAYISNSSSGDYSYAVTTSSVAHLYRNITLPSSSDVATLSFDWKGNGESGYDYLQVFLVETTVTPTAGTQLSNTPLATYNLSGSWQRTSIALPASSGARRLVFSWRNDGNDGAQPPAAIDNIAITAPGITPEDPNAYTVTFVVNGGSTISSQTVAPDGALVAPANPTRSGYTFAGWYRTPSFTFVWDFTNDVAAADVTLYAKWIAAGIAIYTVTFSANGGSGAPSQQTVESGDRVARVTPPTRASYAFDGWYSDAALTSLWSFATGTVTRNMTLYAKWSDRAATGVEGHAPDVARVYPNPTSGAITIENDGAEVLLYSVSGVLLKRAHGNRLDLSGYPDGVYLLRTGSKAVKVVKQ
ncbi:MAG: leucine-rich repeat protein [Prevotellaceae bacterium]|nr:leucine-rich repeat protein [Prevotellaceae bacterium]